MKRLILFTLLFCCSLFVFAQTPQLVSNISPGASNSVFGQFAAYNGKLVFTVGLSNPAPNELWITDGTSAGTQLIKRFDINTTTPVLTELNGLLYFTAYDTLHGSELWVTDGTPGNTYVLTDIGPGKRSGVTGYDLVVYNGKLYFAANDSTHGSELWVSDGTAAGTQMVKDINPGTANNTPGNLVTTNNRLYFLADDGANGSAVWSSGGTAQNTQMVYHLAGNVSINQTSTISNLIAANNKLYFTIQVNPPMSNPSPPYIAFCTNDGTTAGTTTLMPSLANSTEYKELNGKVYFYASYYNSTFTNMKNGLWVTDGTPSGTTAIKDSMRYSSCTGGFNPLFLTTFNNKLYFACGGVSWYENQLWVSDGTSTGTVMMKDFSPTSNNNHIAPACLKVVNNRLYFKAWDDQSNRTNIWISDGSAAGTKVLPYPAASVNIPDVCADLTSPITVVDSSLYFGMNYDLTSTGLELYKLQASSAVNDMVSSIGSFNVFPNPASDNISLEINLNSDEEISADILTAEGKLLKHLTSRQHFNAGHSVLNYPINMLANGLYFLRIRAGAQTITKKMIIQR